MDFSPLPSHYAAFRRYAFRFRFFFDAATFTPLGLFHYAYAELSVCR